MHFQTHRTGYYCYLPTSELLRCRDSLFHQKYFFSFVMAHIFITKVFIIVEIALTDWYCGHLTHQSCITNPFVLYNCFHGLVPAVEQWVVAAGLLIREETFRSADGT